MQSDGNSFVASEEVCQGYGLNLIHYPFILATQIWPAGEGAHQVCDQAKSRN